MNQSLESIKIFFDYNQKPFWKIINAETNGLVTENYKVDDMGLSWDRLVIAYNTFVHSGSFKLIVKPNKDTADNKSAVLPFTKVVGVAGMAGISGMGDMSMFQQMMFMQQMQNPHLAGVNAKNEDKLERLQEDNTRLKEELLAAKFTAQISELKRDNKESTRKRGIGEIAAPLFQQHLPTIINAITGNNIPRAAVGVADTNEQIPVPVVAPIVKNTETVTESGSLQKTDILIEPGFHSIDHAVMMLEELETLLPDFNINHVLQNLVVSTQTNPDNMKMMIQNYL